MASNALCCPCWHEGGVQKQIRHETTRTIGLLHPKRKHRKVQASEKVLLEQETAEISLGERICHFFDTLPVCLKISQVPQMPTCVDSDTEVDGGSF